MKQQYVFIIFCMISASLRAMVFDNRFMPLYQKPFTRYCDEPCRLIIQPFTMLAHHTWIDVTAEVNPKEEGPLFSGLYGYYNQVAVDRALVAAGVTTESLFRSDLQMLTSLPWCQRGRFEGHGIALNYDQTLFPHFGFGFSLMCMQVNSRMDMWFKDAANYPPGDVSEFYQIRNTMARLEGLTPGLYTKFDFGDIDFYLRFGALKEYCLKFRKIDVGLRFGVLFPTAQPRPINNPASIYAGGDGHWGVYTAFDTELELKDDLKVGLWARVNWRFAKTSCQRIPLAGEPSNFGVLRTPVTVKPGITGIFMPYFSMEGLRDGFGIKLIYTIVKHANDCWRPCKVPATITIPKTSLETVQQQSGWGQDYLTVDLMYDFAKDKICRRFAPCVQLAIDIPFNFTVAKRSFKTFGVSCLIQTDF